MTRHGVPIRWLLLGANALVLLVPLFVLGGLRVYNVFLMRQTERQLIAQAVLIGEAWKDALAPQPPLPKSQRLHPFAPRIDIGVEILPPQSPARPCKPGPDSEAAKAARRIEGFIRRAQIHNLSAVRLLDARGCVVATTRSELGLSLREMPEVRGALRGRYSSVGRRRVSDQPAPSLASISRRGDTRIFAALPVRHGGRVVGVVRVSRTSLSAVESLWLNRRGLLVGLLVSLGLILTASLGFARAISRPLRRLRNTAEAVVDGRETPVFQRHGYAPAELNALADALERMTQQLQARAEYTAAYAADVTHELKAPITSIRGAAELMADDAEMDPEQRARFLRNIESDALRMERLVRRLLELTRVENAVVEDQSEVPLRDFIGELQARYDDALSVRFEDAPATVTMNADRLQSAICNLIDNALEHGGGHAELILGARDGRLLVTVRDGGAGIPEEKQAAIFERFYTTKKDAGGTGLGLPLVRAIAESRGGHVTCRSRPGQTELELLL